MDGYNPFMKSSSAVDGLPSQSMRQAKTGPLYGSVSPEKKRPNNLSSNPFHPQPQQLNKSYQQQSSNNRHGSNLKQRLKGALFANSEAH